MEDNTWFPRAGPVSILPPSSLFPDCIPQSTIAGVPRFGLFLSDLLSRLWTESVLPPTLPSFYFFKAMNWVSAKLFRYLLFLTETPWFQRMSKLSFVVWSQSRGGPTVPISLTRGLVLECSVAPTGTGDRGTRIQKAKSKCRAKSVVSRTGMTWPVEEEKATTSAFWGHPR